MSERKTEAIVRAQLSSLNYSSSQGIRVEEQKSEIENIRRLLRHSSKTGGQGTGFPEFIITSTDTPDFVMIIECKAFVRSHESLHRNQPAHYAVDGALHYGASLARDYHVIAVAVSGQTETQLKVSTFIFTKGQTTARELCGRDGKMIDKLISWPDYIANATYDPAIQRMRVDELMNFTMDLYVFMRDYAKLTESEKPLLVSGTLIALRDSGFQHAFSYCSPENLRRLWLDAIKQEIDNATIPFAKKRSMVQPYQSISVHPELGIPTVKAVEDKYPRGILYELIRQLYEKVWPFINNYHDFDVVGQFYGEFLRYTGGDKRALGIVLTPRHITELFALLANVKPDDRVLDICAGTGGFLISAMQEMMRKAVTTKEIDQIRRDGLVGVEQQPNMFCLAASNMILRGDGKANLYQGSCFNESITEQIKAHQCNVGMLNPPYSQGDESLHELAFVKHMLDCLTNEKPAIGIAIVPMSCAITPSPLKEEILRYHTLEAVMSMPDDLFYPVGTVTCIMVFTPHIPHAVSNRKTWFGYWKDDGFIKTKHKGRVDLLGRWEKEIRPKWVDAFRNRDEVPGLSVKRQVTAQDEWCAEAYMDTDYSTITPEDFEREIKKFIAYQFLNKAGGFGDETSE